MFGETTISVKDQRLFRSNRLPCPEDFSSTPITEEHQVGRLPVQEENPTGSDQTEKPSHNSKNILENHKRVSHELRQWNQR